DLIVFVQYIYILIFYFFFSSRRRHTRFSRDWSSDVCSSDLANIMPNVDVITSGVLPHNPAEVLLSPKAAELLQELSQDYDVVVLDTAPVLPVSDALALAPYVGTVFMLARAQVSTLSELEESTKRLAQVGAQ